MSSGLSIVLGSPLRAGHERVLAQVKRQRVTSARNLHVLGALQLIGSQGLEYPAETLVALACDLKGAFGAARQVPRDVRIAESVAGET